MKSMPCIFVVATLACSDLCAAQPTPEQALSLRPVQTGVTYDSPTAAEVKECTVAVEKDEEGSGWVVRTKSGKLLRKFLDVNNDNVVDLWIYFDSGKEVYRDVDTNGNGKADQYRWIVGNGTRLEIDSDEDGKIDLPKAKAAPPEPRPAVRGWALLVGVDDYNTFSDLRFAGNDAAATADTLIRAGFSSAHTVLLSDKSAENRYRPFKANIEKQLDLILSLAEPDDLVVAAFFGHGIHIDGTSYLCPADADDARPRETMISVDRIYKQFGECRAAMKLLVVDACRNDPRPPGKRSATPAADLQSLGVAFERPPDGMLVLASCSPGQVSWEDEAFGHGVFTKYLLNGLNGAADGNQNGRVTLGELYEYASMETKAFVLNKRSEKQVPALKGEINGVFEFPRAVSTN